MDSPKQFGDEIKLSNIFSEDEFHAWYPDAWRIQSSQDQEEQGAGSRGEAADASATEQTQLETNASDQQQEVGAMLSEDVMAMIRRARDLAIQVQQQNSRSC